MNSNGVLSVPIISINSELKLVIEIKGDEDITAVNKAKLRYARKHFGEVNEKHNELRYYFKFLSPTDFPEFFEEESLGSTDFPN